MRIAALLVLLLSGCSAITLRSSYVETKNPHELNCGLWTAPPVIDTAIGAPFAILGIAGLAQEPSSRDFVDPRAIGAIALAISIPWIISAIHGHRVSSACRERRHLLQGTSSRSERIRPAFST